MEKGIVQGKTEVSSNDLIVDGQQVMQDWQKPLMKEIAESVASEGIDILEVGFGLGIASSFISGKKPKISYNNRVQSNSVSEFIEVEREERRDK